LQPSTPSATPSASYDAGGKDLEPADSQEDRSEESQTSGSPTDSRDDARSPPEGAMFCAAIDNEHATALEDLNLHQVSIYIPPADHCSKPPHAGPMLLNMTVTLRTASPKV
jgi:hypothetical protein